MNQAIQLDPKYARAYDRRGIEYKNKGEYDRAIEDYDRAIGLQPDNWTFYYNRGSARYFKNQFDLAVADYNLSIAIRPTARALINRGRCHYAVTRFREAIA